MHPPDLRTTHRTLGRHTLAAIMVAALVVAISGLWFLSTGTAHSKTRDQAGTAKSQQVVVEAPSQAGPPADSVGQPVSCLDLPLSSQLILPDSCYQTGAASILAAGSDPSQPANGAVAVVLGQAQTVTDLPASGPLTVVASEGQTACVSSAQNDDFSVNLSDGSVTAATTADCVSVQTASGASSAVLASHTPAAADAPRVALASPVAASVIPPPVTFSYYEYASYAAGCGVDATTACTLYVQGQSTISPSQGGILVLDFGSQCNSGATYGAEMFGSPSCTSDATIRHLAQEWIQGYESDHGLSTPEFTLALGTSNSYTAADPSTGYEPASLQTAGADWFQDVVGASYTSGAAPISVWGASDIEQASDDEWYDGTDTIDWVSGYSAAAFHNLPSSACGLTTPGFLADYGDYNSGELAAADWTENQVYDVSQGITGTCALPEIYYSGDAPEWLALSQWAQSQGSPAMQFTAVMVEPGGSAACPPPNGSTLMSASCAWKQIEDLSGQNPAIPGVTQIATALQSSGPQVSAVSPDYGPDSGGTTITISGSGFLGAQSVYFGVQPVAVSPGQVNSNGTSITVVTPTVGPSTADVVVVTALGSSPAVAADQFQFVPSACTAVSASLQVPAVSSGYGDHVIASATCPTGASVLYSYFIRAGDSVPWTLVAAWTGPTWTWQTAGLPNGAYQVLVWASDGPYTVPQVQTVADLSVITEPACTTVSASPSPASTVAGGFVSIPAIGTCPSGSLPEYSYFVRSSDSNSWTLAAAWIGPTWSWSTVGLEPGTYQVLVWVSDGPYTVPQAQAETSFTVNVAAVCSALSVAAPTTVLQGGTVSVVATPTCPTGSAPLFSYFLMSTGQSSWTLELAWAGPSWSLQTSGLAPGIYQVLVWVSDGPYTVPQQQTSATVAIGAVTACTGLSVSAPSTATTGLSVAITASGTCPAAAAPLYTYFVRKSNSASWTLEAAWIGPHWSWQTANLLDGFYELSVWLSDGPYTVPQQAVTANISLFTQAPCTAVAVQATPSPLAAGQPVTVSAAGTCPGGTQPLYTYFTAPSAAGPWTLQAAWTGPKWIWSTTDFPDGTYYVLVWVSGADYETPEAQSVSSVVVNTPAACSRVSATATPSSVASGQTVTVAASATCPAGTTPQYSYFTGPSANGPFTLQAAWIGGSWAWSTAGLSPGTYYVTVWASDGPYTVPQVATEDEVPVTPVAACSALNVSAPTSVESGQPINVSATSTCPSGAQPAYSYFTRAGSAAGWTLQAAWIGSEWTLVTVGLAPGTYQVLVWASDGPYTTPQVQTAVTITVTS